MDRKRYNKIKDDMTDLIINSDLVGWHDGAIETASNLRMMPDSLKKTYVASRDNIKAKRDRAIKAIMKEIKELLAE